MRAQEQDWSVLVCTCVISEFKCLETFAHLNKRGVCCEPPQGKTNSHSKGSKHGALGAGGVRLTEQL